jgi:Ni/Fe-hydrogenase subunit HybB-like protein
VVPTMEHPFLPIQNVPMNFKIYEPTAVEIAITLAPIILAIMIISILLKLFPVVPITDVHSNDND